MTLTNQRLDLTAYQQRFDLWSMIDLTTENANIIVLSNTQYK